MAVAPERVAAPAVRLGYERPALLLVAAVQQINGNRLFDALALVERVLDLDPANALAWSCKGSLLERLGDPDGTLAAFERAVEIGLDDPRILSNQIFALDRHASVTLDRACAARRRYNALVAPADPPAPHENDRDPDRVLRVGYVSADFRQHSALSGFGPVLLQHDPSAVDVVCYSATPEADRLTGVVREAVPTWREVAGATDDELEALIRADRIDILVDLSGHSAGNRLPVFARKPAPVQVSAWGYPTGTGLDAVDYLFSDDVLIAPDEERHYAEAVVRLPRVMPYWPDDPADVGEVAAPPAAANGYLTLGVFNRLGKLTPDCLALWARVLEAVPDARLVVKAPGLEHADLRAHFEGRCEAAGFDLARVALLGATDHPEHMRAYRDIDLLLDPWPDGGGISTLEGAWMGVPTLTAPWHQISSRFTASFNRELGLDCLTVRTPSAYVERVVAASEQLDALAEIRRWLRDLVTASAFGSHALYARAVERHYRAFWRRWVGQAGGVSDPRPALRLVEPQGA